MHTAILQTRTEPCFAVFRFMHPVMRHVHMENLFQLSSKFMNKDQFDRYFGHYSQNKRRSFIGEIV